MFSVRDRTKKAGSRYYQVCKPLKMYDNDSIEKERVATKNYDNFIQLKRECTKARLRVGCEKPLPVSLTASIIMICAAIVESQNIQIY